MPGNKCAYNIKINETLLNFVVTIVSIEKENILTNNLL